METQTPKTQDEARQYAQDWQQWAGKTSMSYGEVMEWGLHFSEIANKFGLVDEFKENGII